MDNTGDIARHHCPGHGCKADGYHNAHSLRMHLHRHHRHPLPLLLRGMKQRSPVPAYVCPIEGCRQHATTWPTFTAHLAHHRDDHKTHRCAQCGWHAGCPDRLRAHVWRVHERQYHAAALLRKVDDALPEVTMPKLAKRKKKPNVYPVLRAPTPLVSNG